MRAVLALAVVCVNAGCPLTYIYNVPEFWDEPFSLNDLGEQSVTTIFGRKCNAERGPCAQFIPPKRVRIALE